MILLFLTLAQPMVQDYSFSKSEQCYQVGVQTLTRDPFYVSHVTQVDRSRYDIAAPQILGIIFVDGNGGAIIRFDDKTEVVYVGDVVKEHVVVSICDSAVVVRDKGRKEKRWVM